MKDKGNVGRHSVEKTPKKEPNITKKTERKKERKVAEDKKIIDEKQIDNKKMEEPKLDEIEVTIPVLQSPVDEEANQKDKKKKHKKMNKILKFLLVILIVFLLVFVTIFARYMIKSGGNVEQAFKEMFKDAVGDQDPVFVLVLGISEDISAELTDTIMLIGYNPDTNQAFVLSIPRDTFVGNNEAKAGGFDKINALYQKDPQKTVAAVENITGIKIDHYVVVKTSVLVKIVDTLGGVDFDVPVNMNYDDSSQDLHIHLKAGYQKLNGDQAEQLVRFRHNNDNTSYPASYGDNDEGRTRTQREFLKVVAQQVISTKDPEKIKTIAKAVFDNLETNVTLEQAFGYIPYAIDFNMENLEMAQLPGQMGIMNSLWFFKVNHQKTDELISGYINKLGLTEAEKKKYLVEKKVVKTTGTSTSKNTTNTNTTEKSNKNENTTKNNTTDDSKKNETKKSSNNTTNNTTGGNTTTKPKNNTVNNNTSTGGEGGNTSGQGGSSSGGGSGEGGGSSQGGNSTGGGNSAGGGSSEGGSENSGGSSGASQTTNPEP